MTQKQQILSYMKIGNSITSLDALIKFGASRLADVVFKLKQRGYPIKSVWVNKGKKRFKKYYLEANND